MFVTETECESVMSSSVNSIEPKVPKSVGSFSVVSPIVVTSARSVTVAIISPPGVISGASSRSFRVTVIVALRVLPASSVPKTLIRIGLPVSSRSKKLRAASESMTRTLKPDPTVSGTISTASYTPPEPFKTQVVPSPLSRLPTTTSGPPRVAASWSVISSMLLVWSSDSGLSVSISVPPVLPPTTAVSTLPATSAAPDTSTVISVNSVSLSATL